MNRAIIVHCWGGVPEYCWYPWVKKELEAKGFKVDVPALPETDAPNLAKWLPVLQQVAGEPDENLYIIGHSVGCITILRYLELLAEGQKVGGVVLVAGFTDDLREIDEIEDELKSFFQTPIQWDLIKSRAKKFTIIHSDNDPYVPLKHADTFIEKLGAELIMKPGFKHFSGPIDQEDSCLELPEVVTSVLKAS